MCVAPGLSDHTSGTSGAEPRPWGVLGDQAVSALASAWTCSPSRQHILPTRSQQAGPTPARCPWPQSAHARLSSAVMVSAFTRRQGQPLCGRKLAPNCCMLHSPPGTAFQLPAAGRGAVLQTDLPAQASWANPPGAPGSAVQRTGGSQTPRRLGLSPTRGCPGCQGSRSLGFPWAAWSLGLQGAQHSRGPGPPR